MNRKRRQTVVMIGIVLIVMAMTLPAIAGPVDEVGEAASAAAPAQRLGRRAVDVDVVSISNVGEVDDDVRAAVVSAAKAAGAAYALGTSASLPMRRISRGATVVQAARSGFSIPMGTTVLPPAAIAVLMGDDVATATQGTSIVMGELTALLRGARAGDRIELVASNGSLRTFTIGAVVADEIVGGTELLMSDGVANLLGIDQVRRLVVWGFPSRSVIDRALGDVGLVTRTDVRISRSWDPPNPDSTLGMARTKAAFGEFEYRVTASGAVVLDDDWQTRYISRAGPIGKLSLRSGCHVVTRAALQDAIDDLIAAGLEDTLNYFDANRAGGCFVPRFNRLTPDSSIGFLSRHSWGMAVDTNTIGSCQGCAPPDMDCRTVQIFRRNGFAWGGNFLTPDGMHYEWVGERRDQLDYPSRFCGNDLSAAELQREAPPTVVQRASMFAADGLTSEG